MVIVLIRTRLRDGADLPAYEQLNHWMAELALAGGGFVFGKSYRSDDGDEISLLRFSSAVSALTTAPGPRSRRRR